MFKIAILVLNYNGKKHLDAFMKCSSFMQSDSEVELIIVDNASSDESLPFLRAEYPWVRIVRNDQNYGWGEGYNKAIETLTHDGLDFSHYLFLNNDVFPNGTWLSELKRSAKAAPSDIAEIGCRALYRAPRVKETLFQFASPHDRDELDVTLLVSGQWSQVDKHQSRDRYWLNFECGVQKLGSQLIPNLKDGDRGYIGLIGNRAKKQVQFQLGPGYRMEAVSPTAFTTLLITKSDSPHEPTPVTLRPGQRVIFARVFSRDEKIEPVIQNSGIGLNERFEGFDLHGKEMVDQPQDHTAARGVCGVCKLVTKEAFHAVGGFDPMYFMYYEDIDFSLSLQKKGYRFLINERARIDHLHAGTSTEFSAFFNRQVLWSLLYFHYKHAGFLRRLKTLLRFTLGALNERITPQHEFAKPMTLALKKFRREVGGNYLAGQRKA